MRELAAAAAKLLQSCPTLCDPIDGSPPGSPVPGILQARTLEWLAIYFSDARKWKVKVKSLSRVWLFMTPWTAAYQAPPPMGFSRQEYWSGLPLPSPEGIRMVYKTLKHERKAESSCSEATSCFLSSRSVVWGLGSMVWGLGSVVWGLIQPSSHIRAVSFQPHIRWLFSLPWLANLEG